MGNLVSNFFDEENEQESVQEQIQPPFLEQSHIKKKRKNKTARKRRGGERNNITMNNHSSYTY
jgi:hypothetical protein